MNKEGKKVGIFGVGPSSIAAIDKLGSSTVFQRADTLLPKRSVYTTSSGYKELFDKYVPEDMMAPMHEIRMITHRGTDFTIPTGVGYCMVDFPGVMKNWRQRALEKSAQLETLPAHLRRQDVRVREHDGKVTLSIQGGSYEFDSLIDASGTQALIASQIEARRRNEDYFAEYVCGGTFRGEVPDGQMMLVFGPGAGTSWVNRSVYQTREGESLVDVVFSGWGYRSYYDQFRSGDGRDRLNLLVQFMQDVPDVILDPNPIDLYYGLIRSQRTPRPKSHAVFAVGEAGGTAKPVFGESFNRALEAGDLATDTILRGDLPKDFYDAFYNRHRHEDFILSTGINKVNDQLQGFGGAAIDTIGAMVQEGRFDNDFLNQLKAATMQGIMSPAIFLKLPGLIKRNLGHYIGIKLRPSGMHGPKGYPFKSLDELL